MLSWYRGYMVRRWGLAVLGRFVPGGLGDLVQRSGDRGFRVTGVPACGNGANFEDQGLGKVFLLLRGDR